VVKRPLIAKKPTVNSTPDADNWVSSGGIDPEIPAPAPPVVLESPPAPESPPQAKPYPHRISFDMSSAQYKRLKRASFESELSMNEILRSAVEAWLRSSDY
jgi:hypothetical protein